MDFDELLITTGVDSLIRLVREHKEIELQEAAIKLKLPVQTVREWAQILEEEKIITVKYKLAKSYLSWIQPTEEEIEEEKESFSREKSSLSSEISELNKKLTSEKENLQEMKEAFNHYYNSLYPELKKLDEKTRDFSKIKEKESHLAPVQISRIEELYSKLEDIESMLVFTSSQLDKMRKELIDNSVTTEDISSLKSVKSEIDRINKSISSLEERSYAIIKSLPSDVINYSEIEGEVSNLKKDFQSVVSDSKKIKSMTSKNEKLFLEIENLKKMLENKEGLSSLRSEIEELSKVLGSVESRFSLLSKKLEDSKKVAGNLESYKSVLEELSKSGSLINNMQGFEKKCNDLSTKISNLENSLSHLSNVASIVKDFENIRKDIDRKRDELSESASDIFRRLDEEDETYKVFQKIKEKSISSIEEYNHQISSLKTELDQISKDAVDLKEQLKAGVNKAVESSSSTELATMLSKLEEVSEKKRLFEEIHDSISSLSDSLSGLSKRVSLLSKQAELIEIRHSSQGTSEYSKEDSSEEEDLRSEVELSKSEQLEFQRKRKELMGMIKKLWEEE
ncbi:MAG: hypothetical protein PHU63_01985 [Candidatus ainarchaeum sp.]|nr:hypothetical protein [Candidatus ainarchaeum sp.]